MEEALPLLVVMEIVKEVDNHPLEEVGMVEMVMEMEEVILLHPLTKNTHGTVDTEEIDGYMWYKAPWNPQANLDKLEGMVGMVKYPSYPEE